MRQLNEKEKALIIKYLNNQKPCQQSEDKKYSCNLAKYRHDNNMQILFPESIKTKALSCWGYTYNTDDGASCVLEIMIDELNE